MHTLTRESQEVVVGEILVTKVLLPDIVVALKRLIVLTDIPHFGQLNITTSTLSTPVKSSVSVKSKVISAVLAIEFIVSSSLAHMSPSSPLSVGTFSSNRTLLVGVKQVCVELKGIKLEHLPVLFDPFTTTKYVSKGMKYSSGKTAIIL